MNSEPSKSKREFQVICIWCGVKIRRDKSENSFAECLQCFYRILSERLLSHRRTGGSQFASER